MREHSKSKEWYNAQQGLSVDPFVYGWVSRGGSSWSGIESFTIDREMVIRMQFNGSGYSSAAADIWWVPILKDVNNGDAEVAPIASNGYAFAFSHGALHRLTSPAVRYYKLQPGTYIPDYGNSSNETRSDHNDWFSIDAIEVTNIPGQRGNDGNPGLPGKDGLLIIDETERNTLIREIIENEVKVIAEAEAVKREVINDPANFYIPPVLWEGDNVVNFNVDTAAKYRILPQCTGMFHVTSGAGRVAYTLQIRGPENVDIELVGFSAEQHPAMLAVDSNIDHWLEPGTYTVQMVPKDAVSILVWPDGADVTNHTLLLTKVSLYKVLPDLLEVEYSLKFNDPIFDGIHLSTPPGLNTLPYPNGITRENIGSTTNVDHLKEALTRAVAFGNHYDAGLIYKELEQLDPVWYTNEIYQNAALPVSKQYAALDALGPIEDTMFLDGDGNPTIPGVKPTFAPVTQKAPLGYAQGEVFNIVRGATPHENTIFRIPFISNPNDVIRIVVSYPTSGDHGIDNIFVQSDSSESIFDLIQGDSVFAVFGTSHNVVFETHGEITLAKFVFIHPNTVAGPINWNLEHAFGWEGHFVPTKVTVTTPPPLELSFDGQKAVIDGCQSDYFVYVWHHPTAAPRSQTAGDQVTAVDGLLEVDLSPLPVGTTMQAIVYDKDANPLKHLSKSV